MIPEVTRATGIALVVLRYLVARVAAAGRSDGRGETASSTPSPDPPEGRPGSGRAADEDAVRCRHCGTENEPGYRFCSGCAGELGGAAAAPGDPLGGHGG
jgi:hypothetical protein